MIDGPYVCQKIIRVVAKFNEKYFSKTNLFLHAVISKEFGFLKSSGWQRIKVREF